MSGWNHLREPQLDVLKEIGNIGAGHAATSLSHLLRRSVRMKVPRVRIVRFDQISDVVGGPEAVVVTVYFRIKGDILGDMFFMMEVEGSKKLAQIVLGSSCLDEIEMEWSLLEEVGNMLSGSYLSSISDFTHLNLQPTVPALAIDMAGAVLSHGLTEFSRAGDDAVVINTQFIEEEHTSGTLNGHFFLLPDPESFAKLFKALGVPFHD